MPMPFSGCFLRVHCRHRMPSGFRPGTFIAPQLGLDAIFLDAILALRQFWRQDQIGAEANDIDVTSFFVSGAILGQRPFSSLFKWQGPFWPLT
jgi:hypothetical protein